MRVLYRSFLRSILLAALTGASCGAAFAHHGSRISYDLSKTVTVKGIVKEFSYENPHIYITFEAKDDAGNPVEWVVETDPPMMMARKFGWSRHYIKPGDEITVNGFRAKDNTNTANARDVILPNGKKVFAGTAAADDSGQR